MGGDACQYGDRGRGDGVRGVRVRGLACAWVCAVVVGVVVGAPAALAGTRVWAVGDGGVAGLQDDALAQRVASEGIDRLLYLGDVYESGTAMEYATNYQTSWGRFKQLTSPTPGNHEWSARREGYDPYWGALAPQNEGGHYYSFDLAGWHFVSLNSHEDSGPESPQAAWLSRDLARYSGTCTIAFHHRPRFAAGGHGDAPDLEPLFARLVGRTAALLAGHNHNYERLGPQRGIVPFVVGSGGRDLHRVDRSDPRLVAFDDTSHGALELVLERGRASYRFVRTDGSQSDAGSLSCQPHTAAPTGPPAPPAPVEVAPPAPPAPVEVAPPASPAPPERQTYAAAPSVRIVRPGGRRVYPRLRTLYGRTRNVKSPVRLTLTARTRAGCRVFDGARFRRASCRTRRSVRALGVRAWRYRLRRSLPRGAYRLTARAAGTKGGSASSTVSFRVR